METMATQHSFASQRRVTEALWRPEQLQLAKWNEKQDEWSPDAKQTFVRYKDTELEKP